jgi:hypothetical protein
MSYENGRVQTDASTGGRVPVWTYDDVEQRMVEAMQHWWRSHDPEARFSLGGRISSAWRQYFPTRLDLAIWGMLADAPEAEAPKALPLSRADMQRMTEASDWLAHVPEDDRRLVVLALTKLAAGHKRVPWSKLLRPLGHQHGADRLRMRYSRALTKVCQALNLAEKRQGGVSTQQMTPPSK